MNSELQRFKIIIKPDLSDVSLHAINMPESIPDDFIFSPYEICEEYRICEDALVFFWNNLETWGMYTGLTSAPFTNFFARWTWNVMGRCDLESLCPASGRFVCLDGGDESSFCRRIVVFDLF